MTDYGLVSIITPNFNCERFIAKTIEAVQSQTYINWELLIQDDCSTDKSYEIALKYASVDCRIKVEKNIKNSGAAITRNNAIQRSNGTWLAFLDSDDLWTPDKLERQLRWMAEKGADFSFTQYEHIDEEGTPMMLMANVIKHLTYGKMRWHCWTGCLTVLFKQDLTHKIYGPDVKNCNDYALFLKVLKEKHHAMGMPECTAFYRIRRKSISRNKFKKIKPLITVLHDNEGINLISSYFYMCTNQLIKLLFKYKKITESKLTTLPITVSK